MNYSDYLHLDKILDAQHPRSGAHDEMLFIIQHQTTELWMKLAIHEIRAAREEIKNDQFRPAFKVLARVARIFEQMNSAWDVLRTLTPVEYTEFRNVLGSSSGFQSHQYREIEFLLGNRNPATLVAYKHDESAHNLLASELGIPCLYDEAILLLARQGFDLPESVTNRNWENRYEPNTAVTQAWKKVYSDPQQHWPLYELAEKLVDFEDYFRRWRFNHVTTVERIIGNKRGTGGTSGVNYLRNMLDVVLFPELWQLRTDL